MDDQPQGTDPTAAQARALLQRAGDVGAIASAGISWPYIATLLTMGAATSLGTLAMSMTTGFRYAISLVAMLVWVAISIAFMMVYGRATGTGFAKRWRNSILAWSIAYAIAIAVAGFSQGTFVLGGVLAAALIAVVTVGCAVVEARA